MSNRKVSRIMQSKLNAVTKQLEQQKPKVIQQSFICPKCGSHSTKIEKGTGPHKYKIVCGECKSFIKWSK